MKLPSGYETYQILSLKSPTKNRNRKLRSNNINPSSPSPKPLMLKHVNSLKMYKKNGNKIKNRIKNKNKRNSKIKENNIKKFSAKLIITPTSDESSPNTSFFILLLK